jgi:peptide/nickel transport system permease protein
MRWYIARRIGQLLPVLLVASLVLFVMLRVVPGDPARQLLGKQATQEQVDQLRAEVGLDKPMIEQYWDWVKGIPTGDLGETIGTGEPVTGLITHALPVTLQLTILAVVIATLIGLPVALFSASRPGGKVDTALTWFSVLATSIPTFVWGLTMVLLFSLTLKLLPSSGYVPFGENPVQWAKSMVMPAFALAMPTIGTLSRVARASMLETLDEPYVQFARSKGISQNRLLLVHGLKNAAVPIVAVAAAEFGYLLGDAVIVETIFSLPGMGKLMIDAFLDRDYAIIQGAGIVYTILVVMSGLLADVVSAKIDPRIRLSVQPA